MGSMNLTDEQINIIKSNTNMRINAVAGSGKTTTLIEYCKDKSDKRILYIAFNKSVKEHAIKKFREKGLNNVVIETAHSLAYKNVMLNNPHYTINSGDYKVHEIFQILDMGKMGYTHNVAIIVRDYFKLICNSASKDINELKLGDDFEKVSHLFKKFYIMMNKGEIPITHDFYLKKYQMSSPILDYDYILFDEGQDASPVMLDIFQSQNAIKVIVGDENQQIYSWRYAINSLLMVDYAPYSLTKSFRFGSEIADLSNRILSWKNIINKRTSMKISGHGTSTSVEKRAILARTNLGLLNEAIKLLDKGVYNIYLEGNINSYLHSDGGVSIYDILNLKNGKNNLIKDPLIKEMENYQELNDYVKSSDDVNLGMLCSIVEKFGNNIFNIVKKIKKYSVNKDSADVVLSTVHKAKGLEFDHVTLSDDFISLAKIYEAINTNEAINNAKHRESTIDDLNEEINILYVAITRTRNIIELPKFLIPSDYIINEKIVTY